MLARCYTPKDAKGLDELLGFNRAGDVRIDRDQIVLVGQAGAPVGTLIWRPGGIVHEFRCDQGFRRRICADALVNFAIGEAISGLYELSEAIFIVKKENEQMAKYAVALGAREWEAGRIFTLGIRGSN